MSGQQPWWYSGADRPGADRSGSDRPGAEESPPPDAAAGGPGLGDLVSMASTLVDWATDRVMAPHADHADPAAHPQCLICRATRVLGAATASGGAEPRVGREIRWIEIDDGPADPQQPHRAPSA